MSVALEYVRLLLNDACPLRIMAARQQAVGQTSEEFLWYQTIEQNFTFVESYPLSHVNQRYQRFHTTVSS